MSDTPRRRRSPWARSIRAFRKGAANALEMLREGRLGAPYRATHEVVVEARTHRLRHYLGTEEAPAPGGPPLLLVPPLMVTSEVYDISPELSAVASLAAQGVDVWLVDFGSPEEEEGGLERTLDDHVLAVDASIDYVREATGADVHLAGYSQGGMFCYQVGAYRAAEGLASIITFGSPVDIHRNLGKVDDSLAERFIKVARAALSGPIGDLQGLPGTLSSRGFKLMNPGQELKQIFGLLGVLPNRDKLLQREPKRRFLGGEGFVAWPGPALRKFIDEMVVNNRMASGGFVIDGKTVSLADIDCPILCFVGSRDDMARPAAVRAIRRAAPNAEIHELTIDAGHFGLVVGRRAMQETWPTVAEWIEWRDGGARATDRPALMDPQREAPKPPSEQERRTSALYDLATDIVDGLWTRLGDVGKDVTGIVDAMRWQLPRLARLESMEDHSRVSIGQALAEQAEAIGDKPFFLWRGRAFSYAEADARVNQVVHVLVERGVKRGHHVGVLMDNGPTFLVVVAAASRIGAIAVLLNAGKRGASLTQALDAGETDVLLADPAHAEAAREAFAGSVMVLGSPGPGEALPDGVFHVDPAIDPEVVDPPASITPNPGRASDVAMLLYTSGTTGLPKAARITNRRWSMAAIASAMACEITPSDTVYCCLPLHHSTGMLIAVGGALVGGARLSLAKRFSTTTFWNDVRRSGATVVAYVGELCRYLVAAPRSEGEDKHPVRLFVGNGMRPEVWEQLLDRFGPLRVLEFYGSTEGNAALANLSGEKIGSVGRPILGPGGLRLARYDVERDELVRGEDGRLIETGPDEPGLLLAKIGTSHVLERFEGYVDAEATEAKIIRDAFEEGDAWFDTGDLLRRDADGDYWFVDRVGDTFRWKGENVSTEQVSAVLSRVPGVAMAAVYGVELPGREGRAGMAALQLRPGASFDGAAAFEAVRENLFPAARPRFLRIVDALETTETLKLVKRRLMEEGCDPGRLGDALYFYDESNNAYSPLTMDEYARLVAHA